MNKIKKTLISLGTLIISAFSKLCGLISIAVNNSSFSHSLPTEQDLYGPPPPTTGEIIWKIAKPIILVVIFIIGLVVITKKIKNKKENTDEKEKR